ncbi:MAG: hypothetical protein V3R25_05670 [Nitrosomonadaceae bacterium]
MSDLFNHTDPFSEFWDAFGYKDGKKPALQSWKRIPKSEYEAVIAGAKRAAAERPEVIKRGITPKMAQGWLTDERWKDEAPEATKTRPAPVTPDDWRQVLSNGDKPVYKSWYRQYCQNDWPSGGKVGPNPFLEFNKYIPDEIYNEYGGIWLWK